MTLRTLVLRHGPIALVHRRVLLALRDLAWA